MGFWDRRLSALASRPLRDLSGSAWPRSEGGGLGVSQRFQTEPSQATRVNSSDIGASARGKKGSNVAHHHQSIRIVSVLLPFVKS